MRYLIFCTDKTCFTSQWMSEEMFNHETMQMVVDVINWIYTIDGKEWQDVTFDHL